MNIYQLVRVQPSQFVIQLEVDAAVDSVRKKTEARKSSKQAVAKANMM
jgi:hypothetical protein